MWSTYPAWHVFGPPDSRLFVTVGYADPAHPRTEANARLIAAAPDLLEVCHAMLELHESGSWGAPPGEYMPLLRAAVAKAIGGSPR